MLPHDPLASSLPPRLRVISRFLFVVARSRLTNESRLDPSVYVSISPRATLAPTAERVRISRYKLLSAAINPPYTTTKYTLNAPSSFRDRFFFFLSLVWSLIYAQQTTGSSTCCLSSAVIWLISFLSLRLYESRSVRTL